MIKQLIQNLFFYKPCKYARIKEMIYDYYKGMLDPKCYDAIHSVLTNLDVGRTQLVVAVLQNKIPIQKVADATGLNERHIYEKLDEVYNLIHKSLLHSGLCDNIFEFD